MDRVAPDQYSQSDPASGAQYTSQQEVRSSNYPQSAGPPQEYGATPSSARSANFPPEYLARHPQHYSQQGAGSMAQATNPSIAAPSPTQYPGPYSPYPPPGHDMSQYQGHPPPPQGYGHWPPQAYGHPHGMPGGPYSSPGTAVSAGGSQATAGPRPGQHPYPPSQVYSFVPIPGAQQHKRPRRRYEEIERMYKCGWNGCEKAYGTLNHLNAHVTMQSHGAKRTPEEFKEIRKEWKARKKEEETNRKAEEERQRSSTGANGVDGPPSDPAQTPTSASYPPGVRPHLPPIGYQAAGGQVPGQYAGGVEQMYQGNGYPGGYPHSPYGQGQQMYPQRPAP